MKRFMHAMYAVLIGALLAGCGGGESSTPTASTISGVAAAGAPLSGTVIIKDSSIPTKQLSTSLAVDGSYSFIASSLTPPFLLQATGTAGGNNYTLYSLATTGGNCNINPLTNLAVTMANGGQELTGVFAAPIPSKILALNTALPAAVASIHNKLAPMFNQVGASPVNVMTDKFTANGQGVDLLFDMVSINLNNGNASIINKADGGIILPSTSIASGILSDSPNLSAMPSTYALTGHTAEGNGNVSAQRKASPYPLASLMTVKADAQGDYKFFVPNGTYEVCGSGSASFNCLNVTVGDGNVTVPDFPSSEQVSFQTVKRASTYNMPSFMASKIQVLRSTTELSNFWDTVKPYQQPLPSVNFNEAIVMAVFDSVRSSGGHWITITDIQMLATGGVVVYAVHQSPGPDCGVVAASFTQPYHIVTTPVFSGDATLKLTESVGPACH